MTTCNGFMKYPLTASLASAALLFSLLPDIAQAQSANSCPERPSDTTFQTGGGLTTPNCSIYYGMFIQNGCPEYHVPIAITRVVGPGTDDQFGSDGTLLNWTNYVANGVLSQNAHLSVYLYMSDIWGGDPTNQGTLLATISVNGKPVKTDLLIAPGSGGPVFSAVEHKLCVDVPIQYLKFAHLAPLGSSPTADNGLAGINDIRLQIQGHAPSCDACYSTAGIGALTFDALAPVIMIHGCCGEDGTWFDSSTLQGNGIVPFAQAFRDAYYPFDYQSVNLNSEKTIEADGQKLVSQIPAAAARYGARHVHLVAHSKGGLNARYFLQHVPSNFGVYSLTTISTPHHGSAAADYYQDAVTANVAVSDNSLRTAAAKIYHTYMRADSMDDLTTVKVSEFNRREAEVGLPNEFTVDKIKNTIAYHALSADASFDPNSHVIGTISVVGAPKILEPLPQLWLYQRQYSLLGEVASTIKVVRPFRGQFAWAVQELPTKSFQVNDFAVTVTSANYQTRDVAGNTITFQELQRRQGENHWSEANTTVGSLVVNAIQNDQKLRK